MKKVFHAARMAGSREDLEAMRRPKPRITSANCGTRPPTCETRFPTSRCRDISSTSMASGKQKSRRQKKRPPSRRPDAKV